AIGGTAGGAGRPSSSWAALIGGEVAGSQGSNGIVPRACESSSTAQVRLRRGWGVAEDSGVKSLDPRLCRFQWPADAAVHPARESVVRATVAIWVHAARTLRIRDCATVPHRSPAATDSSRAASGSRSIVGPWRAAPRWVSSRSELAADEATRKAVFGAAEGGRYRPLARRLRRTQHPIRRDRQDTLPSDRPGLGTEW